MPEASRNEQFWGQASRITQLGLPGPMAQRSYIQGSCSQQLGLAYQNFVVAAIRIASILIEEPLKRSNVATIIQECLELRDKNKQILW